MAKYVYMFSEGNANMRELLGGKGANLAEMVKSGTACPAGLHHHHRGLHPATMRTAERSPPRSRRRSLSIWTKMEEINGKKFGDPTNPLLVSVRSGARASMPGMMDTILNLGLNDEVVRRHDCGQPRSQVRALCL